LEFSGGIIQVEKILAKYYFTPVLQISFLSLKRIFKKSKSLKVKKTANFLRLAIFE
jgi:hypothetical protein